jgi:hypothetical protein
VLGDDANRLQLAPGKTATIELPRIANRRLDGNCRADAEHDSRCSKAADHERQVMAGL